MKRTPKQDVKVVRDCRECGNWKQVSDRVRVSELLTKTIEEIEKRISEDELKVTVGDYLKLAQMQREFEQDDAKEIRVTWIEPAMMSESVR